MSSSASEGDERPRREVAHRIFAAEFDDATLSYSESDEERAPNYVVTPTGARANRLFVAGVLTELEEVGNGQLRARIADPTGVFVVYAGQYQPEALATLEGLDVPAFVALTGKARTFQPEDSDRVFTSIRPESISEVDAATRDRWIVETSARTLDRIAAFARALADDGAESEAVGVIENTDTGIDTDRSDGPESGIALAREHYGTSPAYLAAVRELALDAARLVAEEIEELRPLDVAPDEADEAGGPDLDSLAASGIQGETVAALAEEENTAATEPSESSEPSEPSPTTGPSDEPTAIDVGERSTAAEATTADDEAGSPASATAVSDDEPESLASDDGDGHFDSEVAFDDDETGGDSPSLDDSDTTDDDEDLEEFEGEFDLSEEERAEIEAEYGTDFATGSEVEEPGEADIEPTVPPVEESEEDRPDEETTSDVAATDPATESKPEPDFETETEPEPVSGTESDATESDGEADGDSEDEPGVESVGVPGSTTEADTEGIEESTDLEATSDEPPSGEAPEPAAEESEDGAPEGDTGAEPAEVDVTEAVMDAMRALDDGDGADRGAVIERVGQQYGISEAAADEAIQDALLGGQCYEPGGDRLKAI